MTEQIEREISEKPKWRKGATCKCGKGALYFIMKRIDYHHLRCPSCQFEYIWMDHSNYDIRTNFFGEGI